MSPERKRELALDELRRLIDRAGALPGPAAGWPEAPGADPAPLLLVAEACLVLGDRAGAGRALDAVLEALPEEHPQRADVRSIRERLEARGAARLLDGLEPAERAMAPGYLLMAAQDGELSAQETAALEDRLATADPGLRVEWTWLERARAAMSRVALSESSPAAWERVWTALGASGERAPAGVEAPLREHLERVAGDPGEVAEAELEGLLEKLLEALEAEVVVLHRLDERGDARLERLVYSRSMIERVPGHLVQRFQRDLDELGRSVLAAGRGIVGRAVARRASITTLDAAADPDGRSEPLLRISGLRVGPMLTVPVSEGERVRAVLQVLNKRAGDDEFFSYPDLRCAEEVAAALGRLLDRAGPAPRKGIQLAVERARALFGAPGAPEHVPARGASTGPVAPSPSEPGHPGVVARALEHGDLQVAGLCLPGAGEEYGDWFELVERTGGGLDVVVGDTSGRGPVALTTAAMARAALHALLGLELGPTALLQAANRALCRTLPRGTFLTLALARVDASARITLGSAGHDVALVYRARERRVERLKPGGVALGILERSGTFMAERPVVLGPGDALVIVSDGVTEALSADEEPFDEDGCGRLLEAVARHGHLDAERLVAAVAGEVRAWTGARPFDDDVVVVAMRRRPGPAEGRAAAMGRALRERLRRFTGGAATPIAPGVQGPPGEALDGPADDARAEELFEEALEDLLEERRGEA